VPAPPGAIVVNGVNFIIRVFDEVAFPRTSDVEVRLTFDAGKITC